MLVPLDTGITIPAFYVDKEAGDKLHHHVLSLSQRLPVTLFDQPRIQAVRVLMLPGNSRGPNPWELTLIIVVVLLATGFITSIFMHWHLVRKNRRLREQVEQGLIPPPPDMLPMGKQMLTPAQLEMFPLRTVSKKSSVAPVASKRNSIITSDGQILDEDCCVICLEKVDEGDVVRELPCKHDYHQNCIDPWLTTKCAECPLCKTDYSASPPNSNDKPSETRHEGEIAPLTLEADSTIPSHARRYRDRLLDIMLRRHKRRDEISASDATREDQDVELANITAGSGTTPPGHLQLNNNP
ncbi:hypothetical protein BCR43DRAFT_485156 [Syncephalastrum racemosum]|uniref:RING-type domain-containing protein n=1 Tax=Syncephalastrum racemosum TaxID=13706 RepID=A0A1X2HLY7_SYNRA|nr:hypothetical protein BCR43DRAFT_485156 [Syncephalastrum racemosum]